MAKAINWRKLPVSLTELCIDTTLRCGQSFRWRKSDDDIWSCALRGRLISLKQDSTHLYYHVQWPAARKLKRTNPKAIEAGPLLTPPHSVSAGGDEDAAAGKGGDDDTEAFICHYLNLEPNLSQLYEQWSAADANFKKKAPRFAGVRILRQDAWEALVGFICSSNNNIARISQMMEKLCIHYGSAVGCVDDKVFYDMPAPEALNDARVEAHLRELGFGYRAKYLFRTAAMISEHATGWLDTLRNPESPAFRDGKPADAGEMLPGGRAGYRAAHEQLLSLQGVGPKVADCVCLMGLGWGEAVPVDTHVWQIAVRDYKFGRGKHSSLTKATYDAVGDHFRALWGKEAGWAHSVLFTADLRAFSDRLAKTVEVKEEIIKTEDETVVKVEEIVTVKLEEPAAGETGSPGIKRDAKAAELAVEEKTTTRMARAKRRKG